MSDFMSRPGKSPKGAKNTSVSGGAAAVKQNIFIRILKYLFPWRGDSVREVIRKIIFLSAFVALVYFGGTAIYDLCSEFFQQSVKSEEYRDWVSQGTVDMAEEEIEKVTEEVPEILPDYIKLYSENSDVVGWVKIPDTQIDYAVVQSDDNDYYLTHNLNKEYSKGGSIFADYRNVFTPTSKSANTVLYGHNIYGGGYFSNVSHYHTQYNPADDSTQFYRNHPLVSFNTIYEKAEWKVFACVMFNTQEKYGEVYDYTGRTSFSDVHDFNNFILDIMDRSVFWTDVDVTYGDEILTLSTCYYPYSTLVQEVDTRCAVFARKVREGETSDVNVDAVVRNPNPKLFRLEIDRGVGGAFQGRQWDTSKLLSYDGE